MSSFYPIFSLSESFVPALINFSPDFIISSEFISKRLNVSFFKINNKQIYFDESLSTQKTGPKFKVHRV